MSITDILRGNYVRRFHSNPDLAHVGDTNGHHHAMVAQIVLHLCPTASIDLIHAALHHDSAEQFVGDLPSPFKRLSPQIASWHAAIEANLLADLGIDPDLSDGDREILTLADRLAAHIHVRHVAPHVITGSGWPENRTECLGRAWRIDADVGAKVEAMLA